MHFIVTIDSVSDEYKTRLMHVLSDVAPLLPCRNTPLEISLACLEATSRPPGMYCIQPGLTDVAEEFASLEKKACDAIRAARPWTHVAVVVGTDPDEAFRITFSNGHDGTLEDARDAWNKLRKFGSLELPVHPNHVIRGFVHDRSVLGEVPANLARIRSAILTCAKTT